MENTKEENKEIQNSNTQATANTKEKPKSTVAHKIGVAIGILLCVISIPVIIFNCFIIFQGLAIPDKVPSFAGRSPLIVLSDSMYPTIKGGDLVIVEQCKPKDVKVNDIIAFFDVDAKNTSAVVTHRVKEIKMENGEPCWKTVGDANTGDDKSWVKANKLVGMYHGQRYANIGNVCMWLKSVPGIVVCVGIPILLFVGYDLIRRRLYAKKQRAAEQELRDELERLKAEKA